MMKPFCFSVCNHSCYCISVCNKETLFKLVLSVVLILKLNIKAKTGVVPFFANAWFFSFFGYLFYRFHPTTQQLIAAPRLLL